MSFQGGNAAQAPPMDWNRVLTVADQMAIDSLPEDLRGAVERYVRSRPVTRGEAKDEQYVRGWQDGVEAMRDAMEMCPEPQPPRSR